MAQGSDASGGHAHPKYLAHHFETPKQQFESHKTGMWLFLSTEILLFAGLFCAYAVYRARHPEIFIYAHHFLDKNLGGLNTLVLILSSFTAAWAVRAAQKGQRRLLIGLIIATLVCAFGFLGVKAIEYEHKWKHGLLWGTRFQPDVHEYGMHGEDHGAAEGAHGESAGDHGGQSGDSGAAGGEHSGSGLTVQEAAHGESGGTGEAAHGTDASSAAPGAALGDAAGGDDPLEVHSNITPAPRGPQGLVTEAEEAVAGKAALPADRPRNVQIFFGIYFAMTGLHALHVLAGMTAFGWVLFRAIRGDFSPEYYTAVDLTALYWHLVDLIWIYLFPLLYLIH